VLNFKLSRLQCAIVSSFCLSSFAVNAADQITEMEVIKITAKPFDTPVSSLPTYLLYWQI
jgi:hypothetical protein